MQVTHFCKKCRLDKPSSDFSTLKRTYKETTYTYFQSSCKSCVVSHQKAWRDKQPKFTTRAEDWKSNKSAVPWEAFKGHEILEPIKIYPVHYCGRRYIQELGCLICSRVEVYGKSPIAKVN